MTNLLTVVPDLDIQAHSHIVPSLERALISAADLLTLDALDVAKRAHVPTEEVKRLTNALLEQLNDYDGTKATRQLMPVDSITKQHAVSLLDDDLDASLNGGINTGFLTEVSGESAAGKTQVLLTLLLSVQLANAQGEQKSALYISTEAQLATQRLKQILETHPKLQALDVDDRPSLDRVYSTRTLDLDSQEHILRYQVPILIARHNIGLLVVDSIAANYRAELDKTEHKAMVESRRNADFHAKRSLQISRLGVHLRSMAREYNIAIVVANQVADRFDAFAGSIDHSQSTQRSHPSTPPQAVMPAPALPVYGLHEEERLAAVPSNNDPLSLDHQQRFFSGWGDSPIAGGLKNPSLGLTWTNQLATRIVLHVNPHDHHMTETSSQGEGTTSRPRTLKVVFSAWCASGTAKFEIWQGGLRSIRQTVDEQVS